MLLTAAQGHPMLVELKNGETLNGHLVNCDTWMNLTLSEVIQTSADGEEFVRLEEAYVKGNNVSGGWEPDGPGEPGHVGRRERGRETERERRRPADRHMACSRSSTCACPTS
jgi:small nuclear ribonucleoprotein (snRNP)-like protein